MKTTLAYLYVEKPYQGFEALASDFEACARRFVDSYKKFPAGVEHELVVIFSNSYPSEKSAEIFAGLNYKVHCYFGWGWCTGAAQNYCRTEADCDFFVFACARTHFKSPSWLSRFVSARKKMGHGFYGTHSSLQANPTMESPKSCPHLRTNFYGCHPSVLASHPTIASRNETFEAESGPASLSATSQSFLVTWDGTYPRDEWRLIRNIYRRGDQSNCIAFDRQTDDFEKSNEKDREILTSLADGTIYP